MDNETFLNETFLYVHIPFCRHRCDYCSFYSVDDFGLKGRYIEALKKDIKNLGGKYGSLTLKTLYFGGGSPAVLTLNELEEILGEIHLTFKDEIREFTLEMNPHQVNVNYAKGLKKLGVNRISLGVQSFEQSYLNDIGRKAKATRSVEAYRILKEAGFENISLDLIYGGPNSSVDSVKRDLDQFLSLNPKHISTYCLMVDEGCKLDQRIKTGILRLPDEDNIASQLEFISSYLPGFGLKRYEISNYAKEGYESQHNLAYWEYKKTLGAGAAAVYTFLDHRVENYPDIETYISLAEKETFPLGTLTKLSLEDRLIEHLIMGLRLKKGVSIAGIEKEYKVNILEDLGLWIKKYRDLGFLVLNQDRLYFTDKGLDVSNAILSELF